MHFPIRYIIVAIALLTNTVAAESLRNLIFINSMSMGEGDGIKMIGGYATIPPEAQPELCHLSLRTGSQHIYWFGEPGSRQIRFEVNLPADQMRQAVLKLSDRPLSIRSAEDLERRPGSTFAELKVDDVKIPLKRP